MIKQKDSITYHWETDKYSDEANEIHNLSHANINL